MATKAKEVLKTFRSTNTIYADYSIDIKPYQPTGESSQTDVVESSGGKMFFKTLRAFFRCFLGVKAEK